MKVVIGEVDFDERTRARLAAVARGDVPLGGADQPEGVACDRQVWDELPGVVARKLRRLVPDGFVLSRLELKYSLEGGAFGIKMGGEVVASYEPLRSDPREPG